MCRALIRAGINQGTFLAESSVNSSPRGNVINEAQHGSKVCEKPFI